MSTEHKKALYLRLQVTCGCCNQVRSMQSYFANYKNDCYCCPSCDSNNNHNTVRDAESAMLDSVVSSRVILNIAVQENITDIITLGILLHKVIKINKKAWVLLCLYDDKRLDSKTIAYFVKYDDLNYEKLFQSYEPRNYVCSALNDLYIW